MQIAKTILSKNSNAGGITIPDFKLYYRAIAIKTAWDWHKNRHEDQWNRIEDPDINPRSYAQLIFDKVAKNIQWRKEVLFNKCCWENWISAIRKLKLDPCLSPCTSINSKWIKDLNIRPEILKLVQERAGNSLEAIRIGNDFLSRTPVSQQLRESINKWDYVKLKSSAQQKKWSLN
jgi:uncharacterized protein (DUF736 family)